MDSSHRRHDIHLVIRPDHALDDHLPVLVLPPRQVLECLVCVLERVALSDHLCDSWAEDTGGEEGKGCWVGGSVSEDACDVIE